jgi:hypothetical protein
VPACLPVLCPVRSKVRSPDERTYGSLRLNVKRSSVFEDSFNKLRSKSPAEMRAKLSVAFVGEEGIDAGGVSREWYQVRAGPPQLRLASCACGWDTSASECGSVTWNCCQHAAGCKIVDALGRAVVLTVSVCARLL